VGDVLTFSPPLILTESQADDIVAVIDQAIGDVTAQR
jgi:adenosylmethionine-8-amino-7-oxononanoate aminotransferase